MLELEKYRRNVYSCVRCGICRAKYDENVRRVCPIREHSGGFDTHYAKGRIVIARGILEGELEYSNGIADVLAYCTTCANCVEACSAVNMMTGNPKIDAATVIEAMRADLFDLGLTPKGWKTVHSRIGREDMRNPYGEPKKDRWKWAEELDVKFRDGGSSLVYFVGCTSSYRQTVIATDTVKILKKLNIPFSILKDEWCCGSPSLRTGARKQVEELAEHNVGLLEGAERVISSCAGCARTFRKDYPEMGIEVPFEVLHISEFLSELLKEGKLPLKKEIHKIITYHDPCHIGRHMGVYDEPRDVLKAIPGIELREMYPTRENAWCCGAGGGFRISDPKISVEIAADRLEHAKEVGAEALTCSCPFCMRNLTDAIKETNSDIDFYDITQLVLESLGE